MPIQTLFFGSPQEVIPVLQSLIADPAIRIAAVITQPDRPVGRKKVLTPTPVKQFALEHHLPVLTPHSFDENFLWELSSQLKTKDQKLETNKPDLSILAAFGEIIPHHLLTFPTHGFINLHPSLLPQYRGASPTAGTILRGDHQTGLTVMIMDEAMDHGPLLAQYADFTEPNDNHQTLTARLFQKAAQTLPEIIKQYLIWQEQQVNGSSDQKDSSVQPTANDQKLKTKIFLPPQPQQHAQATFTPIFNREDGLIPWPLLNAALAGQPAALDTFPTKLQKVIKDLYQPHQAALFVERAIRALAPWPGAWTWTNIEGKPRRLKLLTAHLEPLIPLLTKEATATFDVELGEVTYQKLTLDAVRLEGKSTTTWEKFQQETGKTSYEPQLIT